MKRLQCFPQAHKEFSIENNAHSKSYVSRQSNPSNANLISCDDRSDIPNTMHSDINVHDKLHNDSKIRKLKKNMDHNKYYNKNEQNNSKYSKSNSKMNQTQTGAHTLRSNISISDMKSPNARITKYDHVHTARKGLTQRLHNLKSNEKRLMEEQMRKTSPIETSDRLYRDAIIRQKSKETNRPKISRSPPNRFKTK